MNIMQGFGSRVYFIALIGVMVVLWGRTVTAQTGNSCVDCHAGLTIERLRTPAASFTEDIHYQKEFSCQDCHGGDPSTGHDAERAHDRAKGFRGAPRPSEIPALCADCHSDVELMKRFNPKLRVDQMLEYRSSHHGKALAEGDEHVATCTSCHGIHGIRPIGDARSPVYRTNVSTTCGECHGKDAHMRPYEIPTDQEQQYRSSVHGVKLLDEGDLAAPTCNNCHGNHGATPPGLSSISQVCGECHANNRDFFNASPHKAAFAELGLADCIICHGHHDIQFSTDAMLGVSEDALCITCHAEGDNGYIAAATMASALDTLKLTLAEAHTKIQRAQRGGVKVAGGRFDLHDADAALIKARTAVHHFNVEKFRAIIDEGLASARIVIDQGDRALNDLRMRRVGLAFTIPLILLVAVLLTLKIRQIERSRIHR